jgi:hypothetical protein
MQWLPFPCAFPTMFPPARSNCLRGRFQAMGCHKTRPAGQIRTIVLNKQTYLTAREALKKAKALALSWAREHWSDGLKHG